MTLPADPAAVWRAFERTVREDPDAVAVSTVERSITRAALAERAEALALAFEREGVEAERPITLMLPNSIEFVAAFLAVMRRSGIAALASTRYKTTELRAICDTIRPSTILAFDAEADGLAAMLDVDRERRIEPPGEGRALRLVFARNRKTAGASVRERFGLTDRSRPALIKFSSGSTGALKAVLWTEANVVAEAATVIETMALGPDDRVLAPVPLFHSYGFDLGVLPLVFAGVRLVVRAGFSPKGIAADLAAERPSVLLGVPGMYRVLNRARLDWEPDFSRVRHLLSCTAPLPVAQIEAFMRRYAASIRQHYGTSETGAMTLHDPAEVPARPGSVGRAMKNVAIRVVDENGASLPPGRQGEIVVRSDAAAAGAVIGDRPSGPPLPPGEYRTDDLGYLDGDGYLYLDGSRSDVINVGGLKVSPAEVAEALEGHDAVAEAAVIGVEDAQGEAVVAAAVTLHAPASETELLTFCQARLADYKVPRRIHVLDTLPRTASGKILLTAEHLPR